MTTDLIARARAGDENAFRLLVAPYQRDLQLHCYRILGSFHDAEDALQETLLGAWQGLGGFEGRSSIRTWLYRVATNRCLNALRSRSRRPSMDQPMPEIDLPEPTGRGEVLWLEPYPDVYLEGLADTAPGPEARYESREAISLAFVTALQLLPPRQRAALILRDVIGFHAREVAQILGSTEESVTSALKRARASLDRRLPAPGEQEPPPPPNSAVEQEVVERFTHTFETGDVDGLVALLADDVRFAMPPIPLEWRGRDRAGQFLAAFWHGAGRRLAATRANGQPAFGLYVQDPTAKIFHAIGLLAVTLAGDRICAITRFDTSVLSHFRLSRTMPAEPDGPADPSD